MAQLSPWPLIFADVGGRDRHIAHKKLDGLKIVLEGCFVHDLPGNKTTEVLYGFDRLMVNGIERMNVRNRGILRCDFFGGYKLKGIE